MRSRVAIFIDFMLETDFWPLFIGWLQVEVPVRGSLRAR
jgi:hypothetical protein